MVRIFGNIHKYFEVGVRGVHTYFCLVSTHCEHFNPSLLIDTVQILVIIIIINVDTILICSEMTTELLEQMQSH